MSSQKKKGMNLERKQNLTGWAFLMPATILIAWMSFYPMIQAFILSLQTGMGINLKFNGFANYARILKDPTFKQTLSNTIFYLHRSPRPRHEPDHVVLQCVDSPCGYHHRPDLEMDRIQHGLLSLRYAEH